MKLLLNLAGAALPMRLGYGVLPSHAGDGAVKATLTVV
jgi:hypothetical protein